jgi:hypothetical protein
MDLKPYWMPDPTHIILDELKKNTSRHPFMQRCHPSPYVTPTVLAAPYAVAKRRPPLDDQRRPLWVAVYQRSSGPCLRTDGNPCGPLFIGVGKGCCLMANGDPCGSPFYQSSSGLKGPLLL